MFVSSSKGFGVEVLRLMAESAKKELLVQADPGLVGDWDWAWLPRESSTNTMFP